MTKEDFYNYVMAFCNSSTSTRQSIDVTFCEVVDATRKMEKIYYSHGSEPCYDSIDRERVRDFILTSRK